MAIRGNLVLPPPTPRDVEFRVAGPGPDATAGDAPALRDRWTSAGNWRQDGTPAGPGPEEPAWVPPGPSDRLAEQIDVRSVDPESPDFLRPAADSPLATANAGLDSAPAAWVGAVPPPGEEPWDFEEVFDSLTR